MSAPSSVALRYSLLASLVFFLTSCLFVKAPEQKGRIGDDADLSPLPEIQMGEDLVRTQEGDMIALLPEGWVFLDARSNVSDDIISVAVNPEYTLSAVFTEIPGGATTTDAFAAEGLLGLARTGFNKHARKSAGSVKLVGTYAIAEFGTRRFGTYSLSGANGTSVTRCAVFASTIGHFYEFALVPLTVSGRDIPGDREQRAIFNSILTTVQY